MLFLAPGWNWYCFLHHLPTSNEIFENNLVQTPWWHDSDHEGDTGDFDDSDNVNDNDDDDDDNDNDAGEGYSH